MALLFEIYCEICGNEGEMSKQNLTLLTDLYELTMMQGYFENKNQNETVIFDAFYRINPFGGGYSIMAGLEQVIDYVKNMTVRDISTGKIPITLEKTAEEIVDNLTRLFIHGCDMTPLHKDKNNRK